MIESMTFGLSLHLHYLFIIYCFDVVNVRTMQGNTFKKAM